MSLVSKDDCYRALSISKDEELELHLKREPNSCVANNYFDVNLKAWQVIMKKKPVLMIVRESRKCVNISQKLKISVQKSWHKQPRKPLMTS